MKRPLLRVSILILATALALVMAEGAFSLLTGRSLRTIGRVSLDIDPEAFLRGRLEQASADAAPVGPYAVHEDPAVGYVLRKDTTLDILGIEVAADDLGLRRRPGPEPDGPSFRILIVGDSVAFGWGLADDQTLAVQLEEVLSVASGPRGEAVVCRNVAVPSWTLWGELRYVLEHLDELAPSHVLFLVVGNDLADPHSAYETGHRRYPLDPVRLIHVHENLAYLAFVSLRLQQQGDALDTTIIGPSVINAALTRESRERIRSAAAEMLRARDHLERRGVGMRLAYYEQTEIQWHLASELAKGGASIPTSLLIEHVEIADRLPSDPHPNPETVRALALWLAQDLLADGVVRLREGARLAEVPERLRDRRSPPLEWQECTARSRDSTRQAREELRPVIDHLTGEGARQVYGGLNPDSSMAPTCLAVLPPGRTLEVELAPLPDHPASLPLSVSVWIEDQRIGEIALGNAEEPVSAEFPVPAPLQEAPLEVRLEASYWVSRRIGNWSTLASCRFLRLESR